MSDRNIAKKLAGLERHLDAVEAREATFPEHREMTLDEKIEVGLILLAYIFEGDEQAFAEYLVEHFDYDVEGATRIAGALGCILEERRTVAENPRYPV